eukprot:scaffold20878_cov21-Prasinocladus_malaysianus.AAC.2
MNEYVIRAHIVCIIARAIILNTIRFAAFIRFCKGYHNPSRGVVGSLQNESRKISIGVGSSGGRYYNAPSPSRGGGHSASAAQPSQGPGAAHVGWAEGEGSSEVERVFAGSAKMDGESVVVFMRAMCAVSQEELEDSGRVYMLQKLVECAHHNLGRIRLVWGRLWAAL